MKKISLLLVLAGVLFSISTYAMNHDGMGKMGNGTGSGMMMNHENCDCPMMEKLTTEEKEQVAKMTHDEKMEYMLTKFGVEFMVENCKMIKGMSDEEKTKLKAMTKEEFMSYMKDKMGTMKGGCGCNIDGKKGEMKHHMGMGSGNMMGKAMGINGMMKSNNKALTKVHESLSKFFEKLDKETDSTKKIEKLNKIIVKVDKILADTTLSQTKKQIYTHIKHMLEMKIEEIDGEDLDLDGLLENN